MLHDKLKEECGVFGVVLDCQEAAEAAGITYNALLALQHRGQEGAGIAVLDGRSIKYRKDIGLVSEVFTSGVLSGLPLSHMGIGHVRYSTMGNSSRENTQPIIKDYVRGRIAVAHNGNIVNATEVKQRLEAYGCDFIGTNDSEIISTLITFEALQCGSIEDAVVMAARQLKGAFSLVIMTSRNKIIALRDGCGFRPLCIGTRGKSVVVSSESCALESAGFNFLRDIKPGEMVVIEADGSMKSQIVLHEPKQGACIFEYVYFARPDSIIDGQSVYQARYEMGRALARECPAEGADVVCGVPDSGLEAAQGFAAESGLPYVTGFVKNRYIGRSFIFPSQTQREAAVRLKLNPLKNSIEGKSVVLVDDSIVRGTTCAKIIQNLKAAGAKEVHLRISSPPFRHTCHFGTDIGDENKLIVNQITLEQLRERIGAASLGYVSTEGLHKACENCQVSLCTGCFTGKYPIDFDFGAHEKTQLEGEENKE